ncbi:MAG: MarR family transcriptional regulator [Peptococcaceae bacterium]
MTNQVIMKELDVLISQLEERKNFINEYVLKQALKEIEALPEISITEFHVIAYIGNHQNVNGMRLSQEMGMTRGGISKVMSSLQKKNLIESYSEPDNKKKVYYRLTPLGMRINQFHNEKHQQRDQTFAKFLDTFSDEEKAVVLKFIKELQLFAQSR